jgi:hypothetical protein
MPSLKCAVRRAVSLHTGAAMQEQVQIQSYNGALLVTQLFSSSRTILLGAFGTMTTRTLTDDSGQIHVGETVQIGASS